MIRILATLRRLVDTMAGKSIFESALYRDAELARLVNLFAHVDLDRWRGLKVLEVRVGADGRRSGPAPRVLERRGRSAADQAFNTFGCRPSPSRVERIRRESGFEKVHDISSALANWFTARFDWQLLDDGAWRRDGKALRKMWIAEKAS